MYINCLNLTAALRYSRKLHSASRALPLRPPSAPCLERLTRAAQSLALSTLRFKGFVFPPLPLLVSGCNHDRSNSGTRTFNVPARVSWTRRQGLTLSRSGRLLSHPTLLTSVLPCLPSTVPRSGGQVAPGADPDSKLTVDNIGMDVEDDARTGPAGSER